MSDTVQWGRCSMWHHRVLGGLWALCGLFVIGRTAVRGNWDEPQFWFVFPVPLLLIVAGVAFVFGRTWARRTMAVLMIFAGLFFLDMLLMSGWVGNRAGVWQMLGAFGVTVYTLFFLGVSAAWHSRSHEKIF